MLFILGFMAFAQAKDEEFLLGDLGVKIDPAGWDMDRWSDWDFLGKTADGAVVLGVWSTPMQTELGTDAAAWGPAIEAKLVEYGARNPKLGAHGVEPGPPALARLEYSFDMPGGVKGTAIGATMVIAGSNLQIVAMTRAQTAGRAKSVFENTLSKLQLRKPPLPIPEGPLEVGGHTIPAPPGWRKALEAEAETVNAEVAAVGGDDVLSCGWLVRPIPSHTPAILLLCPSRQHFGVLDELTLEDVGKEIAPRLFGKAEPPPVSLLELPDRNALAWTLPIAGKGLRMALVPVGSTAMRVWVSSPVDGPELDTALHDALAAATWAAPQELAGAETVSYYLNYRPLSAEVLCPVTGIGCPVILLGGLGVMGGLAMSRRKKKSADDLD